MTDYTELIRSLRNCSNNRCTPSDCGWFNKYQVDESCKEIIMWKAADAIEALQAENPIVETVLEDKMRQQMEELQQKWFKSETDATNLTGKLAQAEADIDRLNLEIDKRIATEIELSNQVDALQAEVERLKDSNEELREKQMYIDHYGSKWMTSGKDVPTEAYKHGYADGRDEAMAKMEVQDESVF